MIQDKFAKKIIKSVFRNILSSLEIYPLVTSLVSGLSIFFSRVSTNFCFNTVIFTPTYILFQNATIRLQSLSANSATKISRLASHYLNLSIKKHPRHFCLRCFFILVTLFSIDYRRAFNSLANSSNPGFPSKANIFFLYASTPGWSNGLTPFK